MISNFIKFTICPDTKKSHLNFISRLLILLLLFFISKFLIFSYEYLIYNIFHLQLFNTVENIASDQVTGNIQIKYFKIVVISSCILIAIFEELSCRLFLTKFNTTYFIISVSLIIGINIYNLLNSFLYFPEYKYFISYFMNFIYIFTFASITFIIFKISNSLVIYNYFDRVWFNKFPLVYYVVLIVFSLQHLHVLSISEEKLIFFPLIFIPLLIMGHFLGYVRIRFGLLFSILLHILYLFPNIYEIL